MTTHQLAKLLLSVPDIPVRLADRDSNIVEVSGIYETDCTGFNFSAFDSYYYLICEGDETKAPEHPVKFDESRGFLAVPGDPGFHTIEELEYESEQSRVATRVGSDN